MLKSVITKLSKFFKSDPSTKKESSLSLQTLEERNREKIAQLSIEELENLVFRYEEDYFKYLGEHHPEIQAFKKAVESKSLPALKQAIDNFYKNVHKLEKNAGHKGRPLIMDYYFWYEHEIEELEKRVT